MYGSCARSFERKYGRGSIEKFYLQCCRMQRKEITSNQFMKSWKIKSRKVLWSYIHCLFEIKIIPRSETIEVLQNIIDIHRDVESDSQGIVETFKVARQKILRYDPPSCHKKV